MRERLMEFLAYLGISQKKFEENCGLSNGFADKVGDSIREVNLKKITEKYPELNMNWLKTGVGEMIVGAEDALPYTINQSGDGVPYFNVDFIGGFDIVENDQTLLPEYYIKFEKYRDATVWVNVTGDSMSPLISHGDIIALRRIDDWENRILYGDIYAIVTDDFRTIKRLRKSEKGSAYLKIVPDNTSVYDEQDVRVDSIHIVYKVLGCVKMM